MNKKIEWIKAIILLPGNALVVIPFLFLYFSKYVFVMPKLGAIIFGGLLLAAGLFLAAWTMWLFDKIGEGTAGPWAPPAKFVVSGPYCYVRNPMLTSVLVMILAEAILLSSSILVIWFVLFWIINTLYFIFFEEKGLEKRFGDDYVKYKQNVPRWIPRINKPYSSES